MQLNRESLIQAWRAMTTIRHFEERVQEEFSKGGIPGFVHLYAGQEASAVGVCTELGPRDYIASTHRGHGHSIAKGCDVTAMMAELFGKQDGLCAGKGGSMHIADLDQGMLGTNGIVGGGPPLVVGAALTAKTLGTGTVAVSFAGDGGSNQGTTFEAMNLAVVLRLPAIFVFENNEQQDVPWQRCGATVISRRGAPWPTSSSIGRKSRDAASSFGWRWKMQGPLISMWHAGWRAKDAAFRPCWP